MTNTLYKNILLKEDGLFKNGKHGLKFGVDEVKTINENINNPMKELKKLTGLSDSTISRIKAGIKAGSFNKYLNNTFEQDNTIPTNNNDETGTVNINGGIHINIYNNDTNNNSVEETKKINTNRLKQWAAKIRNRGNHICAKCGKQDEQHNQAHHIFPKAKYPTIACDEGNGIVLCQRCHTEYHRKYERKENPYNFIRWLNE